VEYSNRMYSKNNLFSAEGIQHTFLPLKLLRILRFFDYAPLLRRVLKIPIKEEKQKVFAREGETLKRDFTENEKLILYALVKYPQLNDGEIAKKVSMTRQSINKIRKKFENDEVIRRIRIPNMKKLGYEVMLFVNFFINPKYPMDERRKGIEYTLNSYPGIVLLMASNLQTIVIGFASTYTTLKRDYAEFLSTYKKSDYIEKEPDVLILPLEEIKESMDGRYHPLVKKVLNISKDV
jgi:DNA-binding Lrp family transcriptional regulator